MAGIPFVIMHRFSPSQLWQTVKENDVTFFYVLGTMPFYLLKQEENPELEQNHKLRFVLCSGIIPQYHETFEKRWNVPWRDVFGMTETSGDLVVPLEDSDSVGSGAMGAPVRTKEAKVTGKISHGWGNRRISDLGGTDDARVLEKPGSYQGIFQGGLGVIV